MIRYSGLNCEVGKLASYDNTQVQRVLGTVLLMESIWYDSIIKHYGVFLVVV
jgi:hypothetical protein